MKSLTTITGNLDDMDQTVLSLTEFAHLTRRLQTLNQENADLRAQLEAIGAGGVEPLRPRPGHAEDEHDRLARRGCEIDERYAHHLAIELECVLIDPDGNWDSAAKTLDAYKQAWEEISPTPSPFFGRRRNPARAQGNLCRHPSQARSGRADRSQGGGMTEYQTHSAMVESLESEVSHLRAVNAGLVQAARRALEAQREIVASHGQWTNGMWAASVAGKAITALSEALEAAPADPNQEAFRLGYAKGVDDAERRAKARGEQPTAVEQESDDIGVQQDKRVFARIESIKKRAPQPTRQPARPPLPPASPCAMTEAEYRLFKLGWLEAEAAHGIGGEA